MSKSFQAIQEDGTKMLSFKNLQYYNHVIARLLEKNIDNKKCIT